MSGRARRPDIDWLRVFATAMLFPFHVGKVFDYPPFFPIKNADRSVAMGVFTGFVHQWHMPLFFVLAGWSVPAALAARGAGGFARERVARLFVPLVFGTLVLCPPLKWAELRMVPGYTESFWEFLPTYFTVPGRLTWAHLWFLMYLFTFSLLYLPLLVAVDRTAGPRRVAGPLIYLAIVPLAIGQIALRARWPGMQNLVDDWGNFAYYSLFFLFGAALGAWPALEAAVHAEWRRAGVVGGLALLGIFPAALHGVPPPGTVGWWVFWLLSTTAGVGLVAALLGWAAHALSFSNAALDWGREAALPIYVLHQTPIVLVGLAVIATPFGIAVKAMLLLVGSVLATLVVYQVAVRPFPPLRLLLGMKRA
jgi:peptidoglycan/LPS O-acetylase OafA/YrhL